MVEKLESMYHGIYDHIGFGFARYLQMKVAGLHFEKMLYIPPGHSLWRGLSDDR